MLLKPFIAAATLAAAAQAFLLPPELTAEDVNLAETLDFTNDITTNRFVELECPGCPVQVNRHGKVRVKTDKPNHLALLFQIDSHDRLMVNGFELYPESDPFHNVLNAPQIVDKKERRPYHHRHDAGKDGEEGGKGRGRHHNKEHKGPHRHEVQAPQLGFSLQVVESRERQPSTGAVFDLVTLDLQIIEVGSQFISGIPNVHVRLVKDSVGRLIIQTIETTTSQTLPATPMDKQKECNNLLCKWMAFVEDKLGKPFRTCAGKKAAAANGDDPKTMPSHHKFHPGRPHHKAQHYRTWGQLFKNVAAHILLPVLIGIVAGVSVSLIGMMAGTLIVTLWRTFFRRPHQRSTGRRHHDAAQKEASHAEEKSGLIEHEDPPPSYEDEDTTAREIEVAESV